VRLPHHKALPVGDDGRDALGGQSESAPILHRGVQATEPEGCGAAAAAGSGEADEGAAVAAAAAATAPAADNDIYYRPLRPSDLEQCQVSARAGSSSTFQTGRDRWQGVQWGWGTTSVGAGSGGVAGGGAGSGGLKAARGGRLGRARRHPKLTSGAGWRLNLVTETPDAHPRGDGGSSDS
jgi:hypothetical protein